MRQVDTRCFSKLVNEMLYYKPMASKAQIYYSNLFLGVLNCAVIVFCLEKTTKLNIVFFSHFSSEIA